ncbi:hypothetical protein PIB30_066598 [Stylosanthes scabra]|uniref:Uncharacterized protein n=1 Tax=Stylosanthes scabra TaxID=79078 RepID=A0ABU6YPY8_9FABA|nr:hypothetical protein [Stylosanthes scabra]
MELIELVANNQYMFTSDRSMKRGVMEVDTMDAILAQNKAIAQQLTNLNKKIEKLEELKGKPELLVVFVEVLMRIIIAALLEKINHWRKQITWETNNGSPIKILMRTLTIPDGGITLTLVGEGTKIKEETIFRIVHLTLLSKTTISATTISSISKSATSTST